MEIIWVGLTPLCDPFSSSNFAGWWQKGNSEIFKEQGFYEPLLASKMEEAICKDWRAALGSGPNL